MAKKFCSPLLLPCPQKSPGYGLLKHGDYLAACMPNRRKCGENSMKD